MRSQRNNPRNLTTRSPNYHLGFAYGMSRRRADEINEYLMAARLGVHNLDLFLNLGLSSLGDRTTGRKRSKRSDKGRVDAGIPRHLLGYERPSPYRANSCTHRRDHIRVGFAEL